MASEEKLLPNFLDEIFTEIREEEHHTAAETASLPGSTCFELRNRHISNGSTVGVYKYQFAGWSVWSNLAAFTKPSPI